jgi:hypothetical protein
MSRLCSAGRLGAPRRGPCRAGDGNRDALGRNARVTARRVRDSPAGHPGAATTSRTAHLRGATTSGGARAASLGCCVGRGHATYVITVGGTRVVALLVVIAWGHHLPCPTVPFGQTLGLTGGERWVAQIFRAGQPRGGQRRRSAGSGWLGRWSWMVIPARGGRGRGAGIAANRSATSRQRSSSCCRRIHSASTIAVASSSKAVAVWVSVAISLTPFARMLRPGPASDWAWR